MAIAPRFEPEAADFRSYVGAIWRMVESQNRISTDRLIDDPEDQHRLEQIIEEVKPPIPPEARHLPKLLATPFRYWHRSESRFRRSSEKPGIFYASEDERTAVAETAFWKLKLLSRSPGVQLPATIIEHSTFHAMVDVERLIDLTAGRFFENRPQWIDPDDYSACQAFAHSARAVQTQAIRYESARDRDRKANTAILDPACFRPESLTIARSWHLRFERGRMSAYAAFPSAEHLVFTFEEFGLSIGA